MDSRLLETGLDESELAELCECGRPLKTDAEVCAACYEDGESKDSHYQFGCAHHAEIYTRRELELIPDAV